MHVAKVPLRWADQDAQGHVNNAVLAEYLQEARASFLQSGVAANLVGGGCVVVNHRIQYLRVIDFSPTPLDVRVAVVSAGASRFEFGYELLQGGQLCARATTTLCPFDFDTQRPRRLTDVERDWMRQVQAPWDGLDELKVPHLHGRGRRFDMQVRWGDVDRYGHVNNVRFLEYAQEARVALLDELAPDGHDADASMWLVARQDLDYVAQMAFRHDPYEVQLAPSRIGTTSFVLAGEIIDPTTSTLLARSRVVMVHADAHGTPTPIPDALRAALESRLVR